MLSKLESSQQESVPPSYEDALLDAVIEGELEERWLKPFGISWLDLEQVRVILDTDSAGEDASVRFLSHFFQQGKRYEVEIGSDSAGADVTLQADILSMAEIGTFIEPVAGADPLSLLDPVLEEPLNFL